MKLVGVVENVLQEKNLNLIGQLVILEPELVGDIGGELCYQESWSDPQDYDRTWEQEIIPLKHSVANIEIIGVL